MCTFARTALRPRQPSFHGERDCGHPRMGCSSWQRRPRRCHLQRPLQEVLGWNELRSRRREVRALRKRPALQPEAVWLDASQSSDHRTTAPHQLHLQYRSTKWSLGSQPQSTTAGVCERHHQSDRWDDTRFNSVFSYRRDVSSYRRAVNVSNNFTRTCNTHFLIWPFHFFHTWYGTIREIDVCMFLCLSERFM